jgi:hypothetical protein
MARSLEDPSGILDLLCSIDAASADRIPDSLTQRSSARVFLSATTGVLHYTNSSDTWFASATTVCAGYAALNLASPSRAESLARG